MRLKEEIPGLKVLEGVIKRLKEFLRFLQGDLTPLPMLCLPLHGKTIEEKRDRDFYLEVLIGKLEPPEKRNSIWMKMARRKLKMVKNRDLKVDKRHPESHIP